MRIWVTTYAYDNESDAEDTRMKVLSDFLMPNKEYVCLHIDEHRFFVEGNLNIKGYINF